MASFDYSERRKWSKHTGRLHFRETSNHKWKMEDLISMGDHIRFGPAGVPPLFRTMGADLPTVPALLREEGLDALEYQAVRWGQKTQIKQLEAEKLGLEAKREDVLLSLHGSHYINLAGEKKSSKLANDA